MEVTSSAPKWHGLSVSCAIVLCAGTVSVVGGRDSADRTIRLTGFVEAITFVGVICPSIAGQNSQQLVIQRLARNGSTVRQGDLIVEFDRQLQLRTVAEKEAEWLDRDARVQKKRAEQATKAAKDESEVNDAEVTLALARLEVQKNEMLPRIEARKNDLALRAAQDTLTELREWMKLARAADRAALRVLEIQRGRAGMFMRQARASAERMTIRAPMDGLVTLKNSWRSGGVNAMIEEGQYTWPGSGVMDLIGAGPMRVRAKVSQVDVGRLRVGQTAVVRLDSYRDATYAAQLESVSPVAISAGLSSNVRVFVAVFRIDKPDARLIPDLSVAVDVDLNHSPAAPASAPSATRGRT